MGAENGYCHCFESDFDRRNQGILIFYVGGVYR
jgi:hypothetical protein